MCRACTLHGIHGHRWDQPVAGVSIVTIITEKAFQVVYYHYNRLIIIKSMATIVPGIQSNNLSCPKGRPWAVLKAIQLSVMYAKKDGSRHQLNQAVEIQKLKDIFSRQMQLRVVYQPLVGTLKINCRYLASITARYQIFLHPFLKLSPFPYFLSDWVEIHD